MKGDQLNVRVPKLLKRDLDVYCAQEGKKQKDIVVLALQQFLKGKVAASN